MVNRWDKRIFDSISRVAMLQGLREVNGQAVLHVRMFDGQPEHIHLGGWAQPCAFHSPRGGWWARWCPYAFVVLPWAAWSVAGSFEALRPRRKGVRISGRHVRLVPSCASRRSLWHFAERPRSGTKQACILEDVKCWSKLPSKRIPRQQCGQVLGCSLNSKECAFWELRFGFRVCVLGEEVPRPSRFAFQNPESWGRSKCVGFVVILCVGTGQFPPERSALSWSEISQNDMIPVCGLACARFWGWTQVSAVPTLAIQRRCFLRCAS